MNNNVGLGSRHQPILCSTARNKSFNCEMDPLGNLANIYYGRAAVARPKAILTTPETVRRQVGESNFQDAKADEDREIAY